MSYNVDSKKVTKSLYDFNKGFDIPKRLNISLMRENPLLKFKNLTDLLDYFPDEASCRKYFEQIRFEIHPYCPHCNAEGPFYKYKDGNTWKCKDCQRQFSLTKGTIFERTHIPLRKWFVAIYLFSAHKKGISSYQLARDIGITQPCAWHLLHRIRHCMRTNRAFKRKLENVVEVDETYVGGRFSGKRGRGSENKTPVLGFVERQGFVQTVTLTNCKLKNLKSFVRAKVKGGSTVMTDGLRSYNGLNKHFTHNVIPHNEGRYVINDIHTNTIEGFWSWLKRGINGIYHSVERNYLSAYCCEFEYRYNTRGIKDDVRFELTVNLCLNNRLTLKDLMRN